ncbi:hypothetical protein I5G67_gp001 [Mycobacterium phage Aminay]|uniref:Gene 1 ring forming protein domain-containing protein n=1 Tax=Mycobacterium phage Aminay TaxID=2250291 RepID=A0A345KUY7_9CAUD|nr:hypothetical protein I5G67_gp001 [Mycobacterium phage Aminay]AXH46839.1 hypothetical protein SEA_AMINAY_1 [Mycobacterium phage Aminay]
MLDTYTIPPVAPELLSARVEVLRLALQAHGNGFAEGSIVKTAREFAAFVEQADS